MFDENNRPESPGTKGSLALVSPSQAPGTASRMRNVAPLNNIQPNRQQRNDAYKTAPSMSVERQMNKPPQLVSPRQVRKEGLPPRRAAPRQQPIQRAASPNATQVFKRLLEEKKNTSIGDSRLFQELVSKGGAAGTPKQTLGSERAKELHARLAAHAQKVKQKVKKAEIEQQLQQENLAAGQPVPSAGGSKPPVENTLSMRTASEFYQDQVRHEYLKLERLKNLQQRSAANEHYSQKQVTTCKGSKRILENIQEKLPSKVHERLYSKGKVYNKKAQGAAQGPVAASFAKLEE